VDKILFWYFRQLSRGSVRDNNFIFCPVPKKKIKIKKQYN
jgi:hypothetical protein